MNETLGAPPPSRTPGTRDTGKLQLKRSRHAQIWDLAKKNEA